ncbi:MAG: OmpA family protein [Gemmatimonadetes bacterium]|jgi:outer membrane protein OmpA-like peptidoglycan-associated protein|nr:OmpA family protein [Gemmatimonadota bacterium]HNV77221.1 OmpA family protein [Gemmatimonadaceae bacterium]MBK6455173.1 OmpA family protein [Gemmatimonadota bacterium]MBK6841355.1 OmpA family protein [Gemmatimonadota bacterium]MBK7835045.1 OmpA family protein [Gemmatimonadota bacterium]
MSGILKLSAVALAAVTLSACATKGFVRNTVETGLSTERVARAQGDSALSGELSTVKGEVATLKTDVAALRRDLTALRTEFGAKITAMENGMKFAFPVTFAFDDASVRDEDRPSLDRFVQVVNKYYGGALLTVEGFADPAGSAMYNNALSKRRAESVASYLTQAGVQGVSMRTVGMGEARLVVEGAERDQPGAQANRRVVFVIETKGGETATASMQ